MPRTIRPRPRPHCAMRSMRSAARARAPKRRRTPTVAWKSSSGRWGSSIRPFRAALGAGALLFLAGTTAGAQDSTRAAPCLGQRIDELVIYSSAPTAALLRRVPILANFVAAVHTTTHPDLIRRFLLLEQGDSCNELRRAESERILRAQPFIAEASVRMVQRLNGDNILEVRTSDEVALVLGVAATTASPPVRFVRLGDANLSGQGIYLAGDWREGKAYRDGYGGTFVDNQLLGRPYTLAASGHV